MYTGVGTPECDSVQASSQAMLSSNASFDPILDVSSLPIIPLSLTGTIPA